MEKNFVKADSTNLPVVDVMMVGAYMIDNRNFFTDELKNGKTATSRRESSGDDTIGYVQLRRESGICTIKCRVALEYNVTAPSYNVTMVVDENKSEIVSCECSECTASVVCKHVVTFVMWAHRRSEKPSRELESYWKKPALCRVGTPLKFITLNHLCNKPEQTVSQQNASSSVLTEFLQEAKKRKIKNCPLLRYHSGYMDGDLELFSFHNFLIRETELRNDVNKLLEALGAKLDANVLSEIEINTRSQYKSPLWYELQYARIIASKVFEVSRCQTLDDSLVGAIMGAKIQEERKRKRKLKICVLKSVQNITKEKIRPCGLFISSEYPMIAATPDGICKDVVIVVKCPTKRKATSNYIIEGRITDKYMAQMQLQMYVTNLKKGYFCVAHPNFKTSREVDIYIIEFNEDQVNELLTSSETFWKENIYPCLIRSTTI